MMNHVLMNGIIGGSYAKDIFLKIELNRVYILYKGLICHYIFL